MGCVMGRMCNSTKNDKTASIGIGAMIVFIAIILIAGIAASVIIETAGTTERRAMATGQETTAEVATGIKISDIEGQMTTRWIRYNKSTYTPITSEDLKGDTSETWIGHYNNSRIHNLTISITPRSGSSDIDLSAFIVEISNTTAKCLLSYSSSDFAPSVSSNGVFSSSAVDLRPDQFGLIEIEDYDNSCDGNTPVINHGDRVMITINASACFFGISERQDVWGTIFPEEGSSATFSFRSPSVYSDTVYDLYLLD
jgi:flagellin FlaB